MSRRVRLGCEDDGCVGDGVGPGGGPSGGVGGGRHADKMRKRSIRKKGEQRKLAARERQRQERRAASSVACRTRAPGALGMARTAAHKEIERLWAPPHVAALAGVVVATRASRDGAKRAADRCPRWMVYAYLGWHLGLEPERCHVSRLDIAGCGMVVSLLRGRKAAEIERWSRGLEAGSDRPAADAAQVLAWCAGFRLRDAEWHAGDRRCGR